MRSRGENSHVIFNTKERSKMFHAVLSSKVRKARGKCIYLTAEKGNLGHSQSSSSTIVEKIKLKVKNSAALIKST